MSETVNLNFVNWEVIAFFERARIKEAWERLKSEQWYIDAVEHITNDYIQSAMEKYPLDKEQQEIAMNFFPKESMSKMADMYVRRTLYETITTKHMCDSIKEAQRLLHKKDFILSKLNDFLEDEKAIMEIL